ncbi:MAG: hypothetical protein M0Z87_01005 [Actinomycetota bacterium]|nr:hypothetical protein [Actinomycetota bacterium]
MTDAQVGEIRPLEGNGERGRENTVQHRGPEAKVVRSHQVLDA